MKVKSTTNIICKLFRHTWQYAEYEGKYEIGGFHIKNMLFVCHCGKIKLVDGYES